jgi:hypothetical protein
MTDYQRHQLVIANNFFDSYGHIIRERLDSNRIVNEGYVLNSIEESIPNGKFFDFHMDLILTPGALTDYYKGVSRGHNAILEAARRVFPNSPKITESIESFRIYLKSLVNEATVAVADPSDELTGDVDAALSGGEYDADSGGGFWGTLRSLWNALTEDGSAWGIIHLILDLIGILGDWIFPGVGVAADVINGILYLIRGQYLLAAISFIAAVVIGAGDALKAFKGVAKTANPVFVQLVKGNTKGATEAVAKMGTKQAGPVLKFLRTIAGYVGGAVSKAASIMGNFFSGFGKVASYIPGMKYVITPLFESMGRAMTKFSDGATSFCAGLKAADSTLAKETLEKLGKGMKEGNTYKMTADGKTLIAYDKAGKKVGSMPANKLMDSEFVTIKYGKSGKATELFKSPKEFLRYQKAAAKLSKNASLGNRVKGYLTLARKAGAYRTLNFKNLALFVGKQVWKLVNEEEWSSEKGWEEPELEAHGSAALNTWVDDRIAKEKAESGASYIPAITLDSSEKEVYDKIVGYQNHYAAITNQPSVIPVIYDKYENKAVFEEFEEFWKEVGKGGVEAGGEGDIVDHSVADELDKEEENYLEKEEETKEEEPVKIKAYSQRGVFADEEEQQESAETEEKTKEEAEEKPEKESKSIFSKAKSFLSFK